MKEVERVMRVMTHVNIGAGLGMVAWILWSGYQVATGSWQVPHLQAPHTQPPPATTAAPVVSSGSASPSGCCLVPVRSRLQTQAGSAITPIRVVAQAREMP